MGKVHSVLSRARGKTTAWSFCSALQPGPVQHPASSACVSGCSLLLHCRIRLPPRAYTWSPHGRGPHGCQGHVTVERGHASARCKRRSRTRERERENLVFLEHTGGCLGASVPIQVAYPVPSCSSGRVPAVSSHVAAKATQP